MGQIVALGMANGGIPSRPEEFTPELVTSWQRRGIRCLSVAFPRPHSGLDRKSLKELRALLDDYDVHVSQMTGINANLVHHDRSVREDAVARVRDAIPVANEIGARMILSGPGSCHSEWTKHFYGPHRANYASETEMRLVESLADVAKIMEETGLIYVLECHQLTTLRSPEVIKRVLDAVDSDYVKANFDPVNLLDSAYAAATSEERVPEMVDIVKDRFAPSCHVKDISVAAGLVAHLVEVAPGEGWLDLNSIFDAVSRMPGRVDLIVEHLSTELADHAVEFVRQRALEFGFTLE